MKPSEILFIASVMTLALLASLGVIALLPVTVPLEVIGIPAVLVPLILVIGIFYGYQQNQD